MRSSSKTSWFSPMDESLSTIFAGLSRPQGPELYAATEVSACSTLRIGRSSADDVLLMLPHDASSAAGSFGIALEHIEYKPVESLDLIEGAGKSQRRCALLVCRSRDKELRRYFFRMLDGLVSEVGGSPEFTALDAAVRHLVDLFDASRKPGNASVQGLWAEMFVIAHAAAPQIAAAAWHSVPSELFDFAAGADRVEVKSSIRIREHDFSLEQLTHEAGGQTLIASFVLEEAVDGASLNDVLSLASSKLLVVEGRRRLEGIVARTLGDRWPEAERARFSLKGAAASLRFFAAANIPAVSAASLPPEVRAVRFRSDLSALVSMAREQIAVTGELFASLQPLP